MSKKDKTNSEVEVWKKYKSVRLSKAVRDIILANGIDHSGIRERTLDKLKEIQQFVSQMYIISANGKENVQSHLNFIKKMEDLALDAQSFGYTSLFNLSGAKSSKERPET